MDLTTQKDSRFVLRSHESFLSLDFRRKKRLIVGQSENCDVFLEHISVSPIHAVFEYSKYVLSIYDLNSLTGVSVNGVKTVKMEIRVGDVVEIGAMKFVIELDDLPADLPSVVGKPEFKNPTLIHHDHELGKVAAKIPVSKQKEIRKTKEQGYAIAYPLAADPNADFSEYIFEDEGEVYPIFKYQMDRSSVEVIILYKSRIFSVDYVADDVKDIYLVGLSDKASNIEYAYLPKNEKQLFIEHRGSDYFVQGLTGHRQFYLSDHAQDPHSSSILLRDDDILSFYRDDVQIFVRKTQKPPKVANAPYFRKDAGLWKLVFFIFSFVSVLWYYSINIEIDKEKEKEKQPERLATILYKMKPVQLVVMKKEEPKPIEEVKPDPPKPKPPKPIKVEVKPEPTKVTQAEKSEELKAKSNSPVKAKETTVIKNKTAPTQIKGKTLENQPAPSNAPNAAAQKTPELVKAVGHVDTYKSADFAATLNASFQKGGSPTAVKSGSGVSGGGSGISKPVGVDVGTTTGALKKAAVTSNVGSLTDATEGAIEAGTNVGGLVEKKFVAQAGIPSDIVMRGNYDPDIIRKLLRDHQPQFRACYQKELNRSSKEFDGVIVLNFVIGPSGYVSNASTDVRSGDLKPEVRGCVVSVLKGIHFPAPEGGGVVEVNQPMNFHSTKI